jgi:hypothetical protein
MAHVGDMEKMEVGRIHSLGSRQGPDGGLYEPDYESSDTRDWCRYLTSCATVCMTKDSLFQETVIRFQSLT